MLLGGGSGIKTIQFLNLKEVFFFGANGLPRRFPVKKPPQLLQKKVTIKMLPTYLGNYLQQSREQIDGTPTASSQHSNTQSKVLTATQQQ
jgi:hypothetical protein